MQESEQLSIVRFLIQGFLLVLKAFLVYMFLIKEAEEVRDNNFLCGSVGFSAQTQAQEQQLSSVSALLNVVVSVMALEGTGQACSQHEVDQVRFEDVNNLQSKLKNMLGCSDHQPRTAAASMISSCVPTLRGAVRSSCMDNGHAHRRFWSN